MKRNAVLLLWLMATTMVCAQAHICNKVSPWLRKAVDNRHQQARRAGEGSELLATVFVQLRDGVTDDELAAYGARRYAQLDDIAIVTVPVERVDELAQLADVLRIEANGRAHTTMDTVPKVVNLLPVYEQTASYGAFTGKGVVMGIMDVGFDLTHPNFQADGKTRIAAFWDQLAAYDGDSRFPVGREFAMQEAIAAQGCATDGQTQQHGTHTAGIASGGGADTHYRGVAYESDLCLVANAVTDDTIYIDKADYYKYTSATDALGFKYLFDYAEQQGKPCVVSFSEGYTPYVDRDDSLYSAFIGKLTGPGRIFVSSAGNESRARTYGHKPKGVEQAGAFLSVYKKTARYQVKSDGDVTVSLYIYNRESGQFLQTLELPRQEADEEGKLEKTFTVGSKTCKVTTYFYPSAFRKGEQIYEVELESDTELGNLGRIALVVAGSDYEAEIFGSSSYPLVERPEVDSRWNAAGYGHNILAPGCFETAICVGATTHRQGYTDADGQYHSSFPGTPGLLGDYSSVGPTRTGLDKPDVSAPGTNVIASYSSYYLESHPDYRSDYVAYSAVGDRFYPWGVNSGTSMSTPVVAGIVALWLQANPTLTPADIRGIMQRTCRHPEADLDYPNNRYGYGEIDAYRGLLDILNLTGISEISLQQPRDVMATVRGGNLVLRFADVPRQLVTVSVYSAGGSLVARSQLSPAACEVTVPLPVLPSGIYAVQTTGAERGVTGSQLVRVP